jgi:RimJ/RimL family protein N-acetyltransferase
VSGRRATETRLAAERARSLSSRYVFLAGVGVAAAVLWLRARTGRPEPCAGAGVELLAVDEAVLARMVGAALSDAAADEVTPPLGGPGWGPERIQWLRRFHRDRRIGLDGPLGEATWAVAVAGEVAGAVRLKRVSEPDVLETGIWLTRSARGKGVGRQAVADVLEQARLRGARAVRADTSTDNASALHVLRRLGFRTSPDGDRVIAVKELR